MAEPGPALRIVRAALILNDKAGTVSGLVEPRAMLEAALMESGFSFAPISCDDAGLEAQWLAALGTDAQVFFVAGGDGTLRDAAGRLIRSEAILAPLPGGTMNQICARLGLPNDLMLAARRYRAAEVGLLDVATANGEIFLFQSIVGAPTRLMHFREMQRGTGLRGWCRLLRAGLRVLTRTASHNLAVRIGPGRRKRGHAAVITVPPPQSANALSLELVRPPSMAARLRQALRWFRGDLARDGDVVVCKGARLVLHGPEGFLRLSLDGEMRLARTPLRFRLHRGALRVLVPKTK